MADSMTTEQAISVLRDYRCMAKRFTHLYEALGVAIAALEKPVPSAGSCIEWHEIKTRPLTEEEKAWYAESGLDPESIFDCPIPDDGEDILVATKYGVDTDVCSVDYCYGIGLEKRGDWDGVLAWAKMPDYPLKEDENG